MRLIEDFLARSPEVGKCHNAEAMAEVLAKVYTPRGIDLIHYYSKALGRSWALHRQLPTGMPRKTSSR